MELKRIISRLVIGIALFLGRDVLCQSFSQIVLPFHEQRPFESYFNPGDNSLIIQIKDTRPDEMQALYNYDNRLIRRVIFKELADQGTKITLVLRDQSVKATVYSFEEPYRIVIDLFDQQFKETRDPKTGMPLTETFHGAHPNAGDAEPYRPGMVSERPQQNGLMQDQRFMGLSHENSSETLTKRRLLQPQPKSIMNSDQLITAIEKVSPGIGSNWDTYPEYVYRLQTHSLKTGKSYKSWLKRNAKRAMSSGAAMADYADQLFAFGHELKALLAYQKVLYDDPLMFDKDAKHIWNLAEIHLGQGNRTLAEGYYQSLLEKHPDSPLFGFAQLRLLDIQVIQSYKTQNLANIKDAVNKLDLIKTHNLPELRAQVAIRHGYWDQKNEDLESIFLNKQKIPVVNPKSLNYLEAAYDKVQNPKTAFLVASIILHTKLKSSPWNNQLARLASDYFKKFTGKATEAFRETIVQSAQSSINNKIKTLADAGKDKDAVDVLENLPKNLNTVDQSSELSWLIAESYRKLNLDKKAIPYYKKSMQLYRSPLDKFTSNFRLLQSIKTALQVEQSQQNTATIKSLSADLKREDRYLLQLWSELSDQEKYIVTTKYKKELYDSIKSSSISRSYPEILFWAWSQALTSPELDGKVPATWQAGYTINEDDIYLLSQLSKKFLEIGDAQKSRQTKDLLRHITPNDFKSDRASKLWAQELSELAEEYRKNNQYLDAGRIYALTGAKSENWEKRAEALYKGGLLLYRSGRREEAVKAFEQAAEDGSNLLYAELAKKRLEQLKE